MKVIRIGFMVVTLIWMAFTAYILVRIAEDLNYLRGSSDYTIELLDSIAGDVQPIGDLGLISRGRSFTCTVDKRLTNVLY